MLRDRDKSLLYGLTPPGAGTNGALGENFFLQPEVMESFGILSSNALLAGIDLQIASGFRSFERQLSIWNRKASGGLPVLGRDGQSLNIKELGERDRVLAILRWSALPGASRHHWGTDMDVFDAKQLPDGYRLQLTVDEANNMFSKLNGWLDQQIMQNTACGFFRPYDKDRGGIAPEPWHLSYEPLAREFQRGFSITELATILNRTDMALKEIVLANLQEIYERFIDVPYPVQHV